MSFRRIPFFPPLFRVRQSSTAAVRFFFSRFRFAIPEMRVYGIRIIVIFERDASMKGKRKTAPKRHGRGNRVGNTRTGRTEGRNVIASRGSEAETEAVNGIGNARKEFPGEETPVETASSFPGKENLAADPLPAVAIVGRPNVGKSSLFNAILRRRQAIVHFDSGVTRDRISATGVHDSRRFSLIDTGGLGSYQGEKKGVGFWDRMISEQVDAALASAESILFVVDAQAGLNPLDAEIASRLRSCGKKIILAANKVDNPKEEGKIDDFHSLGFGKIYPVSCLHRAGIQEVMDAALSDVAHPAQSGREGAVKRLRIAVLGRPNVGKSSLVNRLLGEERVIVSNVPGTTRDAIDIEFTLPCGEEEVPAVLVDTAGLRKRSKIDDAVEHYSIMRAAEALESCDIVLFVIEASRGCATSQDKTIARMIEESGKGCIIVSNKWDIRADDASREALTEEIRRTLPQMKYAPVIFTSATTGYHFDELFSMIAELRAQISTRISTAMLNKVISDAMLRNPPPVAGKKPLKVYYGTMTGSAPPRFTLFVNKPEYCSDIYKAYLENYFCKAFSITGFPIRILLRERSRRNLAEVVNHLGSRKKPANAKAAKTAKEKFLLKKKREAGTLKKTISGKTGKKSASAGTRVSAASGKSPSSSRKTGRNQR